MAMPEKIEVVERVWPVSLPGFTEREELVAALSKHQSDGLMLRRVYAAAIGLCSGVGALTQVSYARCGHDVLTYGGKVYAYLREHGASVDVVSETGFELLIPMARQLFPREEEVAEQAGFTDAAEGTST